MKNKEDFIQNALNKDTKVAVYSCDKYIDLIVDNSTLRISDSGNFYYFEEIMPISDYNDKGVLTTDILYSIIRILTKDK